jgi:hypothetical protein
MNAIVATDSVAAEDPHSKFRRCLRTPYRIRNDKRYDPIGSAPVREAPGAAERFGPGHFRLGRLSEAAGVCGGRGTYGY